MEGSEAAVLPELCGRESFFPRRLSFLLVSVVQHSRLPW